MNIIRTQRFPLNNKAMGVIRGRRRLLPLIASEKFIFSRRIKTRKQFPQLKRELLIKTQRFPLNNDILLNARLVLLSLFLYLPFLVIGGCTTNPAVSDNLPCSTHKPIKAEYSSEPALCRYGNPECYDVDGQRYYVLKSARGYCKTGLASWYGTKFHGRKTSSREPYDMFGLTAASTNLPIPTYVEVTNLENGKKIIVKVNDRGPFKSDRIIDLSFAAATKLGFANKGTANVQVRALDHQQFENINRNEYPLLAENEPIPEMQINRITLPLPEQAPKSVTLERYLQVGAFANYDNAKNLQREVQLVTSAKVIINEGQSKGKPLYRVQIGPFKNAEESDQVKKNLEEQGKTVVTVFS